jgi:hypothetical protein
MSENNKKKFEGNQGAEEKTAELIEEECMIKKKSKDNDEKKRAQELERENILKQIQLAVKVQAQLISKERHARLNIKNKSVEHLRSKEKQADGITRQLQEEGVNLKKDMEEKHAGDITREDQEVSTNIKRIEDEYHA